MGKKRPEGSPKLSRNRTIGAFWALLHGFGQKGRDTIAKNVMQQIVTIETIAEEERTPQNRQALRESRDILTCLDMFEADLKASIEQVMGRATGKRKPGQSGGIVRKPNVIGRGTGSYQPPGTKKPEPPEDEGPTTEFYNSEDDEE
jgi:hypothetical protein